MKGTNGGDAGMIGEHESANPMRRRRIWGFLGQGHLHASRTPGDEFGQATFSNA